VLSGVNLLFELRYVHLAEQDVSGHLFNELCRRPFYEVKVFSLLFFFFFKVVQFSLYDFKDFAVGFLGINCKRQNLRKFNIC
jgi:hypothetical protein